MRTVNPQALKPSKLALAVFAISAGWHKRKDTVSEVKREFDDWLVPTFGNRANYVLMALAAKSLYNALRGEARDWLSIYTGSLRGTEKGGKVIEDKTSLDEDDE